MAFHSLLPALRLPRTAGVPGETVNFHLIEEVATVLSLCGARLFEIVAFPSAHEQAVANTTECQVAHSCLQKAILIQFLYASFVRLWKFNRNAKARSKCEPKQIPCTNGIGLNAVLLAR